MDENDKSDSPRQATDEDSSLTGQVPIPPVSKPKGKVSENTNATANDGVSTSKELAREFKWFELASVVINGVLAIVGIAVLCVYHGQLKTMQDQLFAMTMAIGQTQRMLDQTAMQTRAAQQSATAAIRAADATQVAARAASESLRDARRSFELSMRPYIQVGSVQWSAPFVEGQHALIKLTINNSSKSPVIIRDQGRELGVYAGDYRGYSQVYPVPRKELEFHPTAGDIKIASDDSRSMSVDALFMVDWRIKQLKEDTMWVQIQGTLPVYSVFLEKDFEPVHFCFYFLYSLDSKNFWECPPKGSSP